MEIEEKSGHIHLPEHIKQKLLQILLSELQKDQQLNGGGFHRPSKTLRNMMPAVVATTSIFGEAEENEDDEEDGEAAGEN